MPSAPEPPKLALVDGQSYEAQLELESPEECPSQAHLGRGGGARPDVADLRAAHVMARCRPVHGRAVRVRPEPVDFDLGFDDDDAVETSPPEPPKRALIASADRDERLYLRAKLALAELTQADEAETGAQALELARANHYAVALVDFALPDVNGWVFLKELTEARPAIAHVIVIKAQASLGERARGWAAGAKGFLDKPPHPGKLQDLLHKV